MGQNNIRDGYDYFAFISYSRADEKWAKWLQKKMEQYRLPAMLRKEEHTLPKKIQPIFRDKTDLSTGLLQAALHRELDSSKKLIVICSPSSAQSLWVSKEIQHFIDRGRVADIIPLIVDGEVGGGEYECFPQALRLSGPEQLLGISVSELGKNDAFLRVVAGMLNIKFDQLKRRHEQRRKRQGLSIAAAGLVFALIAGFSGYKAWDYYMPHESYYVDYVLRNGVPEGIGQLTAREVAVRETHYTFVQQRGLVRKLVHANSVGTPVNHNREEYIDRPMISQYYYRDDGSIDFIEFVDNNGKVLTTQVYTTDLKAVDFQISSEDSSFKTLAASTMSSQTGMFDVVPEVFIIQRGDITRHVMEYFANGYVTKKIYMRDQRTPILDADGIGGLEYELDEWGRPVEIRYLGLDGDGYAVTKDNIAGKRFFYDSQNNLIRIENFSPQGALYTNSDGWMILEYTYDENGNNVQRSYLNEAGELSVCGNGYAYSILEYDEKGNFIRVAYFDTAQKRVRHAAGPALVEKEYDEKGRLIRQAFFDELDRPTLSPDGNALEVYEYDERGNYAGGYFYDTNYQLHLNSDGYASIKILYDERGNRIQESYFGVDENPVVIKIGIAAYTAEYDEKNNNTGVAYFGTDGQLTLSRYHFAVRLNEFDDRGNLVKVNYFGADGNPTLADTGCATVEYEYNENGSMLGHYYYGLDGKPIINSFGYTSIVFEFDDRGNAIGLATLGLDNEPILSAGGYAAMKGKYDVRGNVLEISFYGLDSQPVAAYEGCAIIRFAYDERDNLIGVDYFGVDGKPCPNADGIASAVISHDERGNVIDITEFDIDGEPI